VYTGLLCNIPNWRKASAGNVDDDDDDDDDFENSGNAPPPTQNTNGRMNPPNAEREGGYILDEAKADHKLEKFLDDPETSLKIFLSSFMRDKGLIWCVSRAMFSNICQQ
jgi:hypothetical protein